MAKRRSIGQDPLDWVGEAPTAPPSSAEGAAPPNGALCRPGEAPPASPFPPAAEDASPMTLAHPEGSFPLARELLLVDGILSRSSRRPRVNQLLCLLLCLVAVLAAGLLLFQETRRQWSQRILSLEGALERVQGEKGRNERLLEKVISEKDQVIHEKHRNMARLELFHESAMDELRAARSESRRLAEENQGLMEILLGSEPGKATEAADADSHQPDSALPDLTAEPIKD